MKLETYKPEHSNQIADIYNNSIHLIAAADYTQEELNAWAPTPIEYDKWAQRLEKKQPFVFPHVPDAWIDHDNTKVGYEIPLNRHFYKYEPPSELEAIDADIKGLETEIVRMLAEATVSGEGLK